MDPAGPIIYNIEMPIPEGSKMLSSYKTLGELRKAYPKLEFAKYVYKVPGAKVTTHKAIRPKEIPIADDKTPVVQGAYLLLVGDISEMVRFAEEAAPPEDRISAESLVSKLPHGQPAARVKLN